MGKFWDWLVDGETNDERPQAVIETAKASEQKEQPKERDYFAESKADIATSIAAEKDWREREKAAFDAYRPTGPAFKIVQMPAGHFVIQRRYTKRSESRQQNHWIYSYGGSFSYVWADQIEKHPVESYDAYETVKNTDAPVMTKDTSVYGYRSYGEEYHLTGYADLAFNVFEDAEAYLFRMAQPQEHEIGYDFPPLKKRAAPQKKATPK